MAAPVVIGGAKVLAFIQHTLQVQPFVLRITMPRNILNLPSYAISRIEKDGHDYHIWAEASGHPSSCQYCGRGEIVGFGRREQLIRDLPMHGKRVGIHVDTRRYRCRRCGKTFYEHPPDVDERRLMTSRLVDWVGKQSIKRPFTPGLRHSSHQLLDVT